MNTQPCDLWAVVLVRRFGSEALYEVARFKIPSDGQLRVAAALSPMTFNDGSLAYGISPSRDPFSPCISVCSKGHMVQPIDTGNVVIDLCASYEGSAFGFGAKLGKVGLMQMTTHYHRMIAALPATIEVLPMPAPISARTAKRKASKKAKGKRA